MSDHLRVGVDVDGILADFNTGYKRLLESFTPHKFPDISDTYPNTWNWHKAAGVSPEHIAESFEKIKADPWFWYHLPPYPETDMFLFSLFVRPELDVYFITDRVGSSAKVQTEAWLSQYDYDNPTVLISGQKGLCAQALKLDFYIDDRNENCDDVYIKSPATRTYMLARPWNTQVHDSVPRVDSVRKFYDAILTELKLGN